LPSKPVLITFDDGRHNQLDYAVPILKKYGFSATFFVCKKWVTGGTKVFMNADEIRQLVADGYDVESHTNSHTFLLKSRSEQPEWMYKRLWGETNGMKVWLEKITGKPVTALAYPGGAYDKYTPGLAKMAGYTTAFTTDSGLNYNGGQSPYLIRRYNAGAKGLRFATYVTIFTHKPQVK
jgi:peptidoglycan/xylan/chitin deacetylase (PgdA/CDA1 family)